MTSALRFSTLAQADFRRITQELTDLQRQVATSRKAGDLAGFGAASAQILTARNLRAAADARESVIGQLDARFGVQGAALGKVSAAAGDLAQSIRQAVSSNDGRGIGVELGFAFSAIVSALNETWNGQPLFAGERQGAGPVKVRTLNELLAAVTPGDLFDEADRRQTIELGSGAPLELAAKASELSQGLFDTLRNLKNLLDASGGDIGQPINESQTSQLLSLAQNLDGHARDFVTEEGRAGQLQKRLDEERTRLQARSDLLSKEIGDQADADLAEVSVRLSALTVQYEAAAKVFADLSNLSLLKYL